MPDELPQPRYENSSLSGAAAAWLLTVNTTFLRAGSRGQDVGTLKRRKQLIKQLRTDPALADLPRLKLQDKTLADVIRWNANETLTWYNTHMLAPENALPLAQGEPAVLPVDQRRAHMRDWLMSYLTPEAVPLVARSITDLHA